MTDEQIEKKLEQLVKLSNQLDHEAKRRYGPDGMLFFESGGIFHVMDGDDADMTRRQSHITFSSATNSNMGAGAW